MKKRKEFCWTYGFVERVVKPAGCRNNKITKVTPAVTMESIKLYCFFLFLYSFEVSKVCKTKRSDHFSHHWLARYGHFEN